MRYPQSLLALPFELLVPKLDGIRRSQIMVSFRYENADCEEVTLTPTKASELYKDWYADCAICPENDAFITDLRIHLPSCETIHVNHDLVFEELMFAIESHTIGRDVKND